MGADNCTEVIAELTRLNINEAAVFVGLTIHRRDGKLVPTLTVMGDTDAVTREQGTRIMRAIIDATGKELQW